MTAEEGPAAIIDRVESVVAEGAVAVAEPVGQLRRSRGSSSGWVRVLAIGLAALAVGFLVLTSLAFFNGSAGWGYDFEAYFLAAQRLARGDLIYQPWTLAEPFRPGPYGLYLYAPPLAASLVPLTMLSLHTATTLWLALRVGLLVGACALMPVRTTLRLFTFAVAAFSEPVLIDLNLGNVSIVVMFLSVVLWRWLDRPAGSVALAVAMSLRPTMGIYLIWWLLRRRWWPVIWTVAAGLLVIALSLPLVGIDGYRDFLRVLGNVSGVTGVSNNLDLGSTVLRLGFGPAAASAALVVGYLIAVAAFLLALRRDREVGFMVTLGASMLLAPLLWDHYLVSLLLPAAFLAQRGRPWALVLPLLAWLPPPFLPLLAVAGTLLPFLARTRPEETYAAEASDEPMLISDSNRTAVPA